VCRGKLEVCRELNPGVLPNIFPCDFNSLLPTIKYFLLKDEKYSQRCVKKPSGWWQRCDCSQNLVIKCRNRSFRYNFQNFPSFWCVAKFFLVKSVPPTKQG